MFQRWRKIKTITILILFFIFPLLLDLFLTVNNLREIENAPLPLKPAIAFQYAIQITASTIIIIFLALIFLIILKFKCKGDLNEP